MLNNTHRTPLRYNISDFFSSLLELDPLSVNINRASELPFYSARQYDKAIDQTGKTLELDPNYILAHSDLGAAYVQKSMYKEGVAEFQKALVISPGDPYALSGLGYSYAVTGREAEAHKVLDQLNELSKRKYVPAWCIAGIYAGLGKNDKAFEWLQRAYEERSIAGFGAPNVNPVFDPLRSDPRFADLLRRMNLQQ